MITRRSLFRGLFAAVGALVFKTFVKATSKGERVFSNELLEKALARGKSLMVTYSTPRSSEEGFFYKQHIKTKDIKYHFSDGTIIEIPNGQVAFTSEWIHGSNSIDDVHFESTEEIEKIFNRALIEKENGDIYSINQIKGEINV